MAHSVASWHNPTFGCDFEISAHEDNGLNRMVGVISAVGRSCVHPSSSNARGPQNHHEQVSGYDAAYALGMLDRFEEQHSAVEVTRDPALNKLAPELGALLSAREVEVPEDQSLRDTTVAVEFDEAALAYLPHFES